MEYVERVNTIEAVQNKGNVLKDVVPFLNEHGMIFEYLSVEGVKPEKLTVIHGNRAVQRLTELEIGDYFVIDSAKRRTEIMRAEEFEKNYQLADEVINTSQQVQINELGTKVDSLLSSRLRPVVV